MKEPGHRLASRECCGWTAPLWETGLGLPTGPGDRRC